MNAGSTDRRPPVEYRVRDHNATDEIVVDFRYRIVFVPVTLVQTFSESPGSLRRAVYAATRQADPLGTGLSIDRGQIKLRDRAPDGEVFLSDDGEATSPVPATVLEYVLGLSSRPRTSPVDALSGLARRIAARQMVVA